MKNFLIVILLTIGMTLHAQERFSSVDGQKFRIREFGKGELTVIFESGMSDSLETWGSIPEKVASFARVFLYDRADIGKSDTSGQKRTVPNMVRELKDILNKENINPPFILVGHSLGGYITRYFCSRYPEDVKGLLLLDPSPEDYWKSMSGKELREYIRGGTEWYKTRFPKKYWKEWLEFIPNMNYMENLNIQENLPVILVSATETKWYKFQKKQLEGLTNSRQIELKGSHHIYKDHPDSIVEYIKELYSFVE